MIPLNTSSVLLRNKETADAVCEILGIPNVNRWSDITVSFGTDVFGVAVMTFILTAEQMIALAELSAHTNPVSWPEGYDPNDETIPHTSHYPDPDPDEVPHEETYPEEPPAPSYYLRPETIDDDDPHDEFHHAAKDGPHSRACGVIPHDHGGSCHENCPTCHGRPDWRSRFLDTVLEDVDASTALTDEFGRQKL